MTQSERIRFHLSRGMSREQLDRIYGSKAVSEAGGIVKAVKMPFPVRLARARTMKGHNLMDLHRILDVTPETAQRYETGNQTPKSHRVIRELAAYLEEDPDELEAELQPERRKFKEIAT